MLTWLAWPAPVRASSASWSAASQVRSWARCWTCWRCWACACCWPGRKDDRAAGGRAVRAAGGGLGDLRPVAQPGGLDVCLPPRLPAIRGAGTVGHHRSEEHTSELQSLMRISYAVFCLQEKRLRLTKQVE